jgi:type II secretory pathway component PulK
MSRALNLNASEAEVLAACARANAAITQIETLVSGGTHVVFKNADDAAAIGRLYKGKIIAGRVTRTPGRLQHG